MKDKINLILRQNVRLQINKARMEDYKKRIERIDNIVCDILINEGADMHIDGHDVLTRFIEAVIVEKENEWSNGYFKGAFINRNFSKEEL